MPSVLKLVAPLLAAVAGGCTTAGGASAAGAPTPAPGCAQQASADSARASGRDTVYVVQHFVWANKRQQFEQFIRTGYLPALDSAAKLDARARRIRESTRVLFPAHQNADGTYTYLFVMDPVIPGETYSILEVLRRAYPAADAARRYAMLTGSWARPFAAQTLVPPGAAAAR